MWCRSLVDFATLTEERILMVDALRDGNARLIADFLEAGGSLVDHEREMLVRHLRGELKHSRGRGRRRTYAQVAAERDIRLAVQALQHREAILRGSKGSLSRAIKAYLDGQPNADQRTVEKHAAGGLSDSWLRAIDDTRAAFFSEHHGG
jgi:hypothetical protein